MSNPELEAAAAIKRLLVAFKGLAELEPALTSLGSVKQAETEARALLAKVQEQAESIKAEIASATAACDQGVADAQRKAESIIADARQKAADIEASTVTGRGVLQKLQADIEAAEGRLAAIKKQLAEIREGIA